MKDYYNYIFCGCIVIIGILSLPFIWLFCMYLSYEIKQYDGIKLNFSKFNQYDQNLLITLSTQEIPSSLLSYRFNEPYGDDKFFSCYANFFEIPTALTEEKIRQIYPIEITLENLQQHYPKWSNPEKCVGKALYYPANEIEQRWVTWEFTYIRKLKSDYINSDLLVKDSTEQIHLSTLGAKNAKIFVAEYAENAYRAIVLYPNSNIVKMITACEGFTEFCGNY